jgi:DNA polymerase I
VGAGGAAALLQKYGSLAAILAAGRFSKQAEELQLYRAIATMNRKAPLPRFTDQVPTWDKAAKLAQSWQLAQLAARIAELANAQARKPPRRHS